MKFAKYDISDKMSQAAQFAMPREAVVENRLAGRRNLDNYTKVPCMMDDMIGDRLGGGGRRKEEEPSNSVEGAINRRRTSIS